MIVCVANSFQKPQLEEGTEIEKKNIKGFTLKASCRLTHAVVWLWFLHTHILRTRSNNPIFIHFDIEFHASFFYQKNFENDESRTISILTWLTVFCAYLLPSLSLILLFSFFNILQFYNFMFVHRTRFCSLNWPKVEHISDNIWIFNKEKYFFFVPKSNPNFSDKTTNNGTKSKTKQRKKNYIKMDKYHLPRLQSIAEDDIGDCDNADA